MTGPGGEHLLEFSLEWNAYVEVETVAGKAMESYLLSLSAWYSATGVSWLLSLSVSLSYAKLAGYTLPMIKL